MTEGRTEDCAICELLTALEYAKGELVRIDLQMASYDSQVAAPDEKVVERANDTLNKWRIHLHIIKPGGYRPMNQG